MNENVTWSGNNDPNYESSSWIGKTVGNYVIHELIGVGGYGTVFKAQHTMMKTWVAVKVSHPIVGTTQEIETILSQGYKALPNISHPNICRILDFGKTEVNNNFHFYLVLELINGQDIGKLPIPKTLQEVAHRLSIFRKVCEAFIYVHNYSYFNHLGFETRGIYHGDIKPDNILIDSQTQEPKIIDFLYVGFKFGTNTRVAKPRDILNEHLTAKWGTNGYMAVEQEKEGIVSAKTEIYSLAITLFEILAPKNVSIQAGTPAEIIKGKINNRFVPNHVYKIIEKSIQSNPDNRYENVQQLVDGLYPSYNFLKKWVVALLALVLSCLIWWKWSVSHRDLEQRTVIDTLRGIQLFTNDTNAIQVTGKYHALLIAIDDYQSNDYADLQRPISDATALQKALTTFYTFEPHNVKLLKNPTRDQIIEVFDQLTATLGSTDNLLVFYAGHGLYDQNLQQGYWLPSDAQKTTRAQWIANSTIREYINGVKTRHTLLISDACYSGSFLMIERGQNNADPSIKESYRKQSRKAITSSSMESVPDESVFADLLIQNLQSNQRDYLTTYELFGSFAKEVTNRNSRQLPQFGRIKGESDQGGDFVWIKK